MNIRQVLVVSAHVGACHVTCIWGRGSLNGNCNYLISSCERLQMVDLARIVIYIYFVCMCVRLLVQANNQWVQQTSKVVQWRPQCLCRHRAARPTTSTQRTCATHHSRCQLLSSHLSSRYTQTSTVGMQSEATIWKDSDNDRFLVHLANFFAVNTAYNSSTSPHHRSLLPLPPYGTFFNLLPLF
jgi:hypothetical protein